MVWFVIKPLENVHFNYKLGPISPHTLTAKLGILGTPFLRVFRIARTKFNLNFWTYPSLRHSLLFSSCKSDTSGILSGVLTDPDTSGMLVSNPCESTADGFDWARLLRASTSVWINFVPGLPELVGWYSPCEAWSSAAPWSWAMGGGGRLGPNPCIRMCVEGTVPIMI